jgi:hypothetical protein
MLSPWKMWKRRKTTIWGYVGVVFGVLEMYSDTVKAMIPEHARGLVPMLLGMGTALIGHYNNAHMNDPPPPPDEPPST